MFSPINFEETEDLSAKILVFVFLFCLDKILRNVNEIFDRSEETEDVLEEMKTIIRI